MKNSKPTLIGRALARVSSKDQSRVQYGSLEQQSNMLIRWAKTEGEKRNCKIKFDKIISEVVSGKDSEIRKRVELNETLRLIEAGHLDFFIVEKVDRLSRDQNFNYSFAKTCQKHGCEFIELDTGTLDLRNRSSRLGFTLKNMTAEDNILELSEKVQKKQREANVNNGKDTSTRPMLGIDAHPTKAGFYTINNAEKEKLLDIVNHFISYGGAYKPTIEYCAEKGYRTKAYESKEHIDKHGNRVPSRMVGGDPINATNLNALLKSPKLRGYNTFEDTWNQFPNLQDGEGMVKWFYAHGAVISADLVRQIDELLTKHSAFFNRYSKHCYFLSGILRCTDGSTFSSYGGNNSRNGRYRDYKNRKHNLKIDKNQIETLVIKRAKEYLINSGVIRDIFSVGLKNRLTGLPMLDEQIKKTESKVRKLEATVESFSMCLRDAANKDPEKMYETCQVLLDERKTAQEELDETHDELLAWKNRKEFVPHQFENQTLEEYLEMVLKAFDNKMDIEKKRIIQTIFSAVIINPDDPEHIELRVNPDPRSGLTREKKVQTKEFWLGD